MVIRFFQLLVSMDAFVVTEHSLLFVIIVLGKLVFFNRKKLFNLNNNIQVQTTIYRIFGSSMTIMEQHIQ